MIWSRWGFLRDAKEEFTDRNCVISPLPKGSLKNCQWQMTSLDCPILDKTRKDVFSIYKYWQKFRPILPLQSSIRGIWPCFSRRTTRRHLHSTVEIFWGQVCLNTKWRTVIFAKNWQLRLRSDRLLQMRSKEYICFLMWLSTSAHQKKALAKVAVSGWNWRGRKSV